MCDFNSKNITVLQNGMRSCLRDKYIWRKQIDHFSASLSGINSSGESTQYTLSTVCHGTVYTEVISDIHVVRRSQKFGSNMATSTEKS